MGWLKALFGGSDKQQDDIVFEFDLSGDAGHFLNSGRDAWVRGDFDIARIMYQKCAYSVTSGGTDREKVLLKQEQADFAQAHPLYKTIVKDIEEIVIVEPGTVQTALYKQLSYNKEDIQWAIYFADELGDLRREKKGRSYAVYKD